MDGYDEHGVKEERISVPEEKKLKADKAMDELRAKLGRDAVKRCSEIKPDEQQGVNS
jgi:hypothetical protein